MSDQPMPIRAAILQQALEVTTKARNTTYGEPSINLQCAGELKAIYARYAGDKYCEAHDEAIEMALTKIARVATGQPGHDDTYIDAAAYMAIAAECQTKSAIASANQSATGGASLNKDSFKEMMSYFAEKRTGLVIEDPINVDTALPPAREEPKQTSYTTEPLVGMLFKTQESGVIIWEITEILADDDKGMKWFKSAVYGRPPASQNPDHFRSRMPASAIYNVVAE